MEINSPLGSHIVDPDTLITLPAGMLGFPELTRFKLFHEEGKPTVFWLQSVDDADIRFAVTDPERLGVDYELTLSDEDIAGLQMSDASDLAVLVTLARDEPSEGGIHANLLAPILINTAQRIGLQKSLNTVQSRVLIRAS
jgi:flagellar assembly factor FliW